MAYEWRENPACVATYKVLEGDSFLNLFEDSQHPFLTAGAVTMGQLHILPSTTGGFDDLVAEQMALKFVAFINMNFTAEKEDSTERRSDIARALATVFINREATVCDLAAAADDHFRFPNEA